MHVQVCAHACTGCAVHAQIAHMYADVCARACTGVCTSVCKCVHIYAQVCAHVCRSLWSPEALGPLGPELLAVVSQ